MVAAEVLKCWSAAEPIADGISSTQHHRNGLLIERMLLTQPQNSLFISHYCVPWYG